VKAIRTIYSLDLASIPYLDIEIAVDVPETEVTFTLVTNKKHKRNSKVSSFPSISSSDFRSKTLFISWASPLFIAVTTCPVSKLATSSLSMINFKTIKLQC